MADEPFATLRLKASCFGLDAHPSNRLLAAGLISGQLKLFSYTPPAEDPAGGSAQQVWSARPHEGACRAVRFSADGKSIYSTGADSPNTPSSARPPMISSGTSALVRWTCSAWGAMRSSAKRRKVSATSVMSSLR